MDKIVDNPVVAFALLGLGEAGSAFAADLVAAGARVTAYDPIAPAVDGVELKESGAAAVYGADVVLSLNSAAAALAVARDVAPALRAGQVFAELNTGAPALKGAVAAAIASSGALFADVALMGPVPGTGARTPSLVSGAGATRYAEAMRPFGTPVEVVGPEPGTAATRKLLRSVFMKGIAAAAIESLAAARAAGCEPWMREELDAIFDSADAALLERLLTGSRVHAVRRIDEVDAAADMLRELGVEPHIASGAGGWLRELARETREGSPRVG